MVLEEETTRTHGSVMQDVNNAILERLERVVETLQDNSVKMGQLLAVHDEKIDKQGQVDHILFEKIDQLHKTLSKETELIKKGCERDIRKVDTRLQVMEKKMWTIFGGLAVISFMVSVPGQALMKKAFSDPQASQLTDSIPRATMSVVEMPVIELS